MVVIRCIHNASDVGERNVLREMVDKSHCKPTGSSRVRLQSVTGMMQLKRIADEAKSLLQTPETV